RSYGDWSSDVCSSDLDSLSRRDHGVEADPHVATDLDGPLVTGRVVLTSRQPVRHPEGVGADELRYVQPIGEEHSTENLSYHSRSAGARPPPSMEPLGAR